jgi:hypothetical protein
MPVSLWILPKLRELQAAGMGPRGIATLTGWSLSSTMRALRNQHHC